MATAILRAEGNHRNLDHLMWAGFENWYGLGYLIWLPILTILYFFHVKPKRRVVSSHFLWQRVLSKKQRNSLFEKFQSSIFYWLQALIFLLIFLALSKPYLNMPSQHRDGVILFDISASMQAVSGGESRFSKAKAEVMQTLKQASSKLQFSVYTCAVECVQLETAQDTLSAVMQLEPTVLPSPPFRHVRSIIAGLRSSGKEVFFVSDVLSVAEQIELERMGAGFYLTGGNAGNVYIDSVRHAAVEGETGLRIRAAKSGNVRDAAVVVRLPGRRELARGSVRFDGPGDADMSEIFLPIAEKADELHVEVSHPSLNLLALDDVFVTWPQRSSMKVAVETAPESSYLLQFLTRFFEVDTDIALASDPAEAQVRIGWNQSFAPHLKLIHSNEEEREFQRSFILDPTSRLTAYLDGQDMKPATWNLSAGVEVPLILAVGDAGRRSVPVLACDNASGGNCVLNLKDEPAILQNVELSIFLENFLRIRALEEQSTPVAVTGGELSKAMELIRPLVESGVPSRRFIDAVGIWMREGNLVFVRIPESESHLTPQEKLASNNWRQLVTADTQGMVEQSFFDGELIIFALVILTLEWLLFLRRG